MKIQNTPKYHERNMVWPQIKEKEKHLASSQSRGKNNNAHKQMRKFQHGYENEEWLLTIVYHVK